MSPREMVARVRSFKELNVYRLAFESAMEIFLLTKDFPAEEKYSLVDQMRRSSRSVCANIAEAWGKRRYRKAFVLKLNESESEGYETRVWLQFSRECGYIDADLGERLEDQYSHIIGQLCLMVRNAEKWTW